MDPLPHAAKRKGRVQIPLTRSFYMAAPQSEASSAAPARLTRTRYAQVPIEVLEKYGDKKGVIIVYCWLWHYAGRDDQAFPSVDRLAAECRMKPDDVRACLKSLAGDGWISRVDRPGQTTLFHVRSERPHPSPKQGTPPPNGGSPKQGTPPLPQMGDPTPPPKGGPNNKHLTKTTYQEVLEPPYPPTGERRAERVDTHPCLDQGEFFHSPDPEPQATAINPNPGAAQPQPTQPVKPWEGPRQPPQPEAPPEPQTPLAHAPVDLPNQKRKAGFTPTAENVPAALLPVVSELLAFWASKGGKRTERAWSAQLGQLNQIQADPSGGTESMRAQLVAGAQAAIFGKPWQAVTYANWQRYGKATPIGGTGFNRKPTTMETVNGAVELIRQRAAAQAAREATEAAEQQQSTLLLAEVA